MKHIVRKVAGVVAAAAIAPILLTATAQADPGTVYFSTSVFNCAITADGTVGCDLDRPMRLQYRFEPIPLTVNEIVIDQPWMPAHPTFDSGTPYTLPGGNPTLESVKTGAGTWGSFIEHGGATCGNGFHGSFSCDSKGRTFSFYDATISA